MPVLELLICIRLGRRESKRKEEPQSAHRVAPFARLVIRGGGVRMPCFPTSVHHVSEH